MLGIDLDALSGGVWLCLENDRAVYGVRPVSTL